MPMDLGAVGRSWDSGEYTWTPQDAVLYALAVGAGTPDPCAELAFTTEKPPDTVQRVLPTFAVLPTISRRGPKLGDFPRSRMRHAEQLLRVTGLLPATGRVRVTSRVTGIHDKRSGALVVITNTVTDAGTGELVAETISAIFVLGEGGFGGPPSPSTPWSEPDRPADHVVTYRTNDNQALLYRLCGDRNPLHSDPSVSARAGFERPILHGLCTYGFAGRAILHAVCGSDPARFGEIRARFAAPVLPGQSLSTHIWGDGDSFRFVVKAGDTTVLDRGFFSRTEPHGTSTDRYNP
ncbi:dehydrogenase [Amycolatopsis sp. NBRC 101858]|nr:dehydrogenase [Amycolatopsis sp. NBRC 101858]